jgi:hypothetical protein
MGFLSKLFGGSEKTESPVTPLSASPPQPPSPPNSSVVLGGAMMLNVVGESYRQDDIWAIVGRRTDAPVQRATTTAGLTGKPGSKWTSTLSPRAGRAS